MLYNALKKNGAKKIARRDSNTSKNLNTPSSALHKILGIPRCAFRIRTHASYTYIYIVYFTCTHLQRKR